MKKWNRSETRACSVAIPLDIELKQMLENCHKHWNKAFVPPYFHILYLYVFWMFKGRFKRF